MHGPIYSKLNMVDLCHAPNSSTGLHWNLDQQRPLAHLKYSISFIHHQIYFKCRIHHCGSRLNMLAQSIDDITLALPTHKQVSAASICQVRYLPNFECFSKGQNLA
ncbi:hypothetical protein AMECASPLE_027441 [Ameca splendens]|uniref:Uncharacterized protein n=1 Tax=Ameca splendens TaxID=208324 RepID=A0ABV1ACD5_9TELE